MTKPKRSTIFNLQCDWEGIFDWYNINNIETRRELKRAVAHEVDAYRNQSWWRKLLGCMPKWDPFDDNHHL